MTLNLWTRLRAMRIRAGLNQTELAVRVGLSPKTISAHENSSRPNIDLLTLEKLTHACGMTLVEFFTFDPAAVPNEPTRHGQAQREEKPKAPRREFPAACSVALGPRRVVDPLNGGVQSAESRYPTPSSSAGWGGV